MKSNNLNFNPSAKYKDAKVSDFNNPRNKSVSRSNAQTTNLCELHNELSPELSRLLDSVELLRNVSIQLYYIGLLQLHHGLRISEVLNIAPHEISGLGFVKINGLKGSNERLIHAGEVAPYLLRCKKLSVYPFQDYNRFFVYREFKKVGLMKYFGDNKKASVTHIFRHFATLQAKSLGTSVETRATQLGHKSTKSTRYYEKD